MSTRQSVMRILLAILLNFGLLLFPMGIEKIVSKEKSLSEKTYQEIPVAPAPVSAQTLAQLKSPPKPAKPYYEGKTLNIFVGFSPGGSAGTEATIVGRHLAKYIPGKPRIIVGFMPGAAGRVLANYISNVAKPDGLTLGRIHNTAPLDFLTAREGVEFDPAKLKWIGCYGEDYWVLYFRGETGFKTIDDIRKAKRKPKVAAIAVGHKTYFHLRAIEKILGLDFDIIAGYPGGADITLAIKRGEIDGRLVAYSAFFQYGEISDYKGGLSVIPLQSGGSGHKRLPDLEAVTTIWELAPKDKLPILNAVAIPWDRPFVAPPGTSDDLVRILREAFAELAKDPEFLAAQQATKTPTIFTSGEEMQRDVISMLAAPPEIVKIIKDIVTGK